MTNEGRRGPRLSKLKMRGQNIASSAMRHVRKTTQSITLSSVDDEELAALEVDVRNSISLVQQERRRRTVAEFSASRDALNRTSTEGFPLSPSSSAFTDDYVNVNTKDSRAEMEEESDDSPLDHEDGSSDSSSESDRVNGNRISATTGKMDGGARSFTNKKPLKKDPKKTGGSPTMTSFNNFKNDFKKMFS